MESTEEVLKRIAKDRAPTRKRKLSLNQRMMANPSLLGALASLHGLVQK